MAALRAPQLLAPPRLHTELCLFAHVSHIRPSSRSFNPHFCRPLSTTTPCSAKAAHRSSGREVAGRRNARAQPSLAIMQKKAQRDALVSGEVFSQIGMLPDTFVTQPAGERPSWTGKAGERWMWEKARLKSRLIHAYQFVMIKYFMVRTKNPADVRGLGFLERLQYRLFNWPQFEIFKVSKIADGLYRDMYTALARGDLESVSDRLKNDILQSLKSRAMSREGVDTKWTLEKYNRNPRLVSYSIALIDPSKPKWQQSYMQQAVVELDSDQSLTRRKKAAQAGGAPALGQTTSSRVREYLVIQKDVHDGVPGRWKIWGTTRPTTILDVKREENKKMGLSDDVY